VRIDPRKLLNVPANPQMVELTIFSINFKETLWDTIFTGDPWRKTPLGKIKLPHHQNNLSFSFTAANLLNPEKVLYSYYLKGFSPEPSSFSNRREVTFSNLSPGSYTLRVEAVNTQSQSSFIPLTFHFRILPPWWKTWYFYTGVFLIILVAVLLVMRLRILRVKRLEQIKLEHEKRLNSIRIQAVQAQMNPHFVFNVLSSIQSFMLDNNMDATMEYLSDFSVLIRKTMENISEKTIFLSDELDYLRRYIKLEDLRLGNSIQYKIIIGEGIDPRTLKIPPMIVQPFVENAIKHGLAVKTDDRKLCVSFQQKGNALHICVSDNGGGLENAWEYSRPHGSHVPKGIQNTTERIRYFTQTFHGAEQENFGVSVSNRQRNGFVKGVKVEIRLPLIDTRNRG
jgi:hypothetical protein